MKPALAVLTAALAASLCAVPAGAEVLGRRQIGLGAGATWLDDVSVDRTSVDFSARIRLPVARNLDVVAFHGQSMLEGRDEQVSGAPYVKTKGTEYGVALTCHVLPKRAADPFVTAGVSNVTTATAVDGVPSHADEDVKFAIGGGAEINIRPRVSLVLEVGYQDSFRAAYGSDVAAGVFLNGWVTELLLIAAGVERSFDTGDISASVRAAYGF